MAHKINRSKHRITDATPKLHDPSERRRGAGWALVLLGALAAGGFIHETTDTSTGSHGRPNDGTELVSKKLSPIEAAIKNGAVPRNEAIILRPGVRLRDAPIVTDVHNGKDGNGKEVPKLTESTVVLKPVIETGPYGDSFILLPNDDGEVDYVSTDVIGMPNEYANDVPYGEAIQLDPESYQDTEPATVSVVKGGEPGIAAYKTTLKK